MEKESNFTVLIEQDEDGMFIAKIPEIEGCYTQGKTLDEAVLRVKEAAEVCLEEDLGNINPMKFIGIQKIKVSNPLNT